MKSGSFKLLEPSGPVQACNGIALPFTKLRELRKKCVGEIFPTRAMKACKGIAPLVLHLGTSPRRVFIFTPRPLYLQEGTYVMVE